MIISKQHCNVKDISKVHQIICPGGLLNENGISEQEESGGGIDNTSTLQPG